MGNLLCFFSIQPLSLKRSEPPHRVLRKVNKCRACKTRRIAARTPCMYCMFSTVPMINCIQAQHPFSRVFPSILFPLSVLRSYIQVLYHVECRDVCMYIQSVQDIQYSTDVRVLRHTYNTSSTLHTTTTTTSASPSSTLEIQAFRRNRLTGWGRASSRLPHTKHQANPGTAHAHRPPPTRPRTRWLDRALASPVAFWHNLNNLHHHLIDTGSSHQHPRSAHRQPARHCCAPGSIACFFCGP